MIKILLTVIHLVVSIILILVVLLQTGKRADLAGAFGGGGSQTAFGARGAATLLSKATTICAVLFMVTSLGLSIVSSNREDRGTVLDEIPAPTAPASSGGAGTATDGGAGGAVPQLPSAVNPAPSETESGSPAETPSGDTDPQ